MPIALIPARGGSKRIPRKNIRYLCGHPLIAYTIRAAQHSGCIDRIVVSTDDPEIAAVALQYGAEVPFLRPSSFASDESPDCEWIRHAIGELGNGEDGIFLKLRATNPLRRAETIAKAWQQYIKSLKPLDSLRSIQLCAEHPGRMWALDGECISPLLPLHSGDIHWHGLPYDNLPKIYVQNGAIEIFKAENILFGNGTTGNLVGGFEMSATEGFDLNTQFEWDILEAMVAESKVSLPPLEIQAG